MKKGFIYYIVCLTAIFSILPSCSEKVDWESYDKWLGEKFNQDELWDMDSITFHRSEWISEQIADGMSMRNTTVKLRGAVQSISCVVYSPDEYKTYIGYNSTAATLSELADAQQGALLAINGGAATDFFKYDGSVISGQTASPGVTNGVIATNTSLSNNSFSIFNCADGNYSAVESYASAMAAGPVIVAGGKEQVFPNGSLYDTRMARSIIGINPTTGNYILATIDKGVAGEADGATMAEAAFIARMMGCSDAICLTSGDGASMWGKEKGVLNAPAVQTTMSSYIYIGANLPSLEGSGTAADPYLIEMPVHFKQMRAYSKPDAETYFKLTTDIDMASIKTWYPVNYDSPYKRKVYFDGNGKTISNFAPTAFVDNNNQGKATGYHSLFGVLYGTCKDVTFKNSTINAVAAAGILGGYLGTTNLPAVIENVHIDGCTIRSVDEKTDGNNLGAFGGIAVGATFKNCSAKNVNIEGPSKFLGGYVGDIKTAKTTFTNCEIENLSIVGASTDVGGFAGHSGIDVDIKNCKAKGIRLSASKNVGSNLRYGGFIGYAQGSALNIENCYSEGQISYTYATVNCAGGLVGYANSANTTIKTSTSNVVTPAGSKTSNTAGICGTVSLSGTCTIENCSSVADLNVHQTSGGIVGRHEAGTLVVNNSFFSGSLTGFSGLGAIVGQSKAGLTIKIQKCFAWSPSITASRTAETNYSSGVLGGSTSGTCTYSGCLRRSDLSFTDPFREMTTHADITATKISGADNQHAFDGTPTDKTLVEVAKAAGWSESIWDFSTEIPTIKALK